MGANDAAEMLEVAKAECLRLERELAVERTRADEAETIIERLRDAHDKDMSRLVEFTEGRTDAEAESARLREVIERVHGLLSDLDLDSGKTTAPGTAWGSILREARALAAVPVEPQATEREGGM